MYAYIREPKQVVDRQGQLYNYWLWEPLFIACSTDGHEIKGVMERTVNRV
jgi:hypothetical protein